MNINNNNIVLFKRIKELSNSKNVNLSLLLFGFKARNNMIGVLNRDNCKDASDSFK